ncbi:hypothetical protein SmJEL517_g05870 [Synchytrium microbalum]|uniref:Cyclopropane-fatty-acyl-phospholipid synthase n=1 Tax=Synchytrium microbalum TaxID=1806994 RepID=A0A507BLK7_9FUNG|nr:uncharacterized protein SmJEL517_g05870 [Synchytrium microbalum]TPX30587.1 hypothetical protein SmJEL517_g05870 [Synchytrium microbalum]
MPLKPQLKPENGQLLAVPKSTSALTSIFNAPYRMLASLAQSACLGSLTKMHIGYLTVEVQNNQIHEFGDKDSDMRAHVHVLSDSLWIRLATFSALGFAEAFMADEVRVDNLAVLLKLFIINRDVIGDMDPFRISELLVTILHSNIPNTIYNALNNIKAHYDLGNELFASFLDPTMTYSCPIWAKEDETLMDAQLRKIHTVLEKAQIQEGDNVLEIGTGWGALAIEAVKKYKCKVTSLTLSKEQKVLAEQRIKAAGFSDSITVLLQDYRTLAKDQQFDKIVTVEMLEAVGPQFLPTFFETCDQLLKKDGILVLQVITMPESRYDSYLNSVDFIQKYIFPGGHCPSITALTTAIHQGAHGNFVINHLEDIGPHYAKALRLWREKFCQQYDAVVASSGINSEVYDDEFKRKWEFYFAYCEAGFATSTLGDIQIRLVREGNLSLLKGVPL